MVYLFYTTYISVDLAHHEIFHAKVGKGGIKSFGSIKAMFWVRKRNVSERDVSFTHQKHMFFIDSY